MGDPRGGQPPDPKAECLVALLGAMMSLRRAQHFAARHTGFRGSLYFSIADTIKAIKDAAERLAPLMPEHAVAEAIALAEQEDVTQHESTIARALVPS
ncbi:MAG TPA: hypothetical protein VED01_07730 [Burkholderiales bacterium]|nr:hypothetical protein [Burkholderiales bacterium]